ncbi:hypothetical protein GCM10009841_26950 [Microlunatus panaciterrae]|uniref:SAM-dependent methyltransferase n=1 Tax=Microlunatus panaciterrae TaxID=400768 RepID=A0ABS2RHI6_9ACTN|nr:class I SAM-dependent methyltransferase [Microlunatus panaciterrae]MBM7798422.1 SAM-dependent methyltransferase [Microlunatus panaciterrae]
MTQHQHRHDAGLPDPHQTRRQEQDLADLLTLDTEVFGCYLDEVTGWVEQQLPADPRTVLDLGAGTGAGSVALARRFERADVLAVDRSALLLDHVRAAAHRQGLAARVHPLQADLDAAWPSVGAVDVAWAASSLHEVADPDRTLADLHAALSPGGLLVVIEMDVLPRFLPVDLGLGRPGLESRCHQALAHKGLNAHPDWRPHLERAGFDVIGQRRFTVEADPAAPSVGRYAQSYLRRIRAALDGELADDDVATLDLLLADQGPDAVPNRRDLTVRSSRTAWAARRPRAGGSAA